MEYFEKVRDEERQINITRNLNQKYPAHFHSNLEIFVVKKGGYTITVNNRQYPIRDGQIIVIDNYYVHSYSNWENDGKNFDTLCIIIPYDFTPVFNEMRKNKVIDNPLITDPGLCKEVMTIYKNYLTGRNEFTQQCSINLILSLLYAHIDWKEKSNDRDANNLIRKILEYIHNNYRSKITRTSIAKDLGYTEAHISRTFRKFIGKGISEYINDLRIIYIENARKTGDKHTLIELIYDAGFSSQQTYYRCRKSLKRSG